MIDLRDVDVIKNIVKEMIQNGEIEIEIKYDDTPDWFGEINYNGEVQETVMGMRFELKVNNDE